MVESNLFAVAGLMALLLVSSGCVADNIEEDSIPGQILDVFGEFEQKNNSTTYEFSIGSMTNNTLMKPVRDAVDEFKGNMSERGLDVQSTQVEVTDVSSDEIEFTINFEAKSNQSETESRNVTMTLVNRNGQWQLKDPFSENMNGSYYDSSSYQ